MSKTIEQLFEILESGDRKALSETFGTWFREGASNSKLIETIDSRLTKYKYWAENLQTLKVGLFAKEAEKHQEEIRYYLSTLDPEQIKALLKME